MGASAITALRELILEVVRLNGRGDWKVFVIDDGSRRLVEAVVKEDDILQENVTNIEQLEEKRPDNKGLDAVYLLTPKPYVLESLIADLQQQKYRRSHLVWTSYLDRDLRRRLDSVPGSRQQIASLRTLNVDFFPRESHLVTFRDPWSFPILFHPACDNLVKGHMAELTQKIVSICVTLGEYPVIRYYRPPDPIHPASVLCSHLARFVQEGLDMYASEHEDFPPPSPRPRGVLIITDRSMDLFAPLIHEFTYQAMVHELLPLKDGDKVFYKTITNQGSPNEEEKEMELGEQDSIWLENRHLHMKDLLEKLVADFNKFKAENPQFTEDDSNPSTINNIKDMIAGLPQFQKGKELYSLHLTMAQECMDIFKQCKLPDVAVVEQSMATGVDEDGKKPKNLTNQLVRLLDDEAVPMPDRLRLIMEYILYRDGVFESDVEKLLAHAQLPLRDGEVIQNLDHLGAYIKRQIKDPRPHPPPLFARKQAPPGASEEISLSRFEPAVKALLEEQLRGTLDQSLFPYTKPQLDTSEAAQIQLSQSSLRSAKPTWARTRPSAMEPRQRIIVFIAGGATYSESRAAYEISRQFSKDVYMSSSHMLTPNLFLRQVGDLSVDRRRLDLPADRPQQRAPAHVLGQNNAGGPGGGGGLPSQPSADSSSSSSSSRLQPLVGGLAAMTMKSGGSSGGGRPSSRNGSTVPPAPSKPYPLPSPRMGPSPSGAGPSGKEKEKKRGIFRF